MDDTELKTLKDLAVPDPSPGARQRALGASLHAFDAERKTRADAAKGFRLAERLMAIFLEPAWRWIMERRLIVGTVAASLLVVPIAAHLVQTDQPRLFRESFAPTIPASDAAKPVPAPQPRQTAEPAEQLAEKSPRPELAKKTEFSVAASRKLREGAPVRAMRTARRKAREVAAVPLATALPPAAPAARSAKRWQGLYSGSRMERKVAVGRSDAERRRGFGPTVRPEEGRDRFETFDTNPVKAVAEHPVSTFSIDVDTASYTFVRRSLQEGRLPPAASVRVEEMINYFSYDYPRPESAGVPFKASVALYPTPWNAHSKLLHIGIKGHEIVPAEKPRSNLVFLIDVSGSMSSRDKLPLLKTAFRLLVDRLEPEDSVAIVTYAGAAGTVLEPTRVEDKQKILAALDRLQSGGSTAGAQGIRQAYALAESAFDKEGVNRVILATDGDFNVGITDVEELKRTIERKRKSGIFLSVLGFGRGNYNDKLMQTLAQNGNGNAAYIDTLREAQKVLVDEAGSTLFPIAKDVKIQIEFNPALVSEYRLIGYETRRLKREDFNNDKVDAGDIGSGHAVTAIYEITPATSPKKLVDDLRYGRPKAPAAEGDGNEYAFLKMRYKLPDESESKLVTIPITKAMERVDVDAVGDDMRFAASVAAFGQKLRSDTYVGDFGYDAILALASGARGKDAFGYRGEFLTLVRLAKSLSR